MESMRLALFTDTYYPEVNGVAKTLERWVRYVRSQGGECLVFAPSRPRKERHAEEAAERLASMPFFLYPECRLAIPQSPGVERKLIDFRPTAIHVATPFGTGLAGRHLALKHGIPLVASHHTHFARYLPFYNLQWMGKLLWRYLHWFHRPMLRVYVPSKSVLEECSEDGWKGLEIWSRGIDTNVFHPDVERDEFLFNAGIPHDRFVVLYAGRLAPEKQTEIAVEAVAKFSRDSGAPAELVVAGEGPSMEAVKELAGKMGVSAHFVGSLTQPALQQWMASSDALLFPSPTETFGNVALEAMACGLPVVAADRGALPDLIRHGENGLICPSGDADAFAAALVRIREDAALRAMLSGAGLAEAKRRSWDGVFGELHRSIVRAAGVLTPVS